MTQLHVHMSVYLYISGEDLLLPRMATVQNNTLTSITSDRYWTA